MSKVITDRLEFSAKLEIFLITLYVCNGIGFKNKLTVPDRRRRIHLEVVLVRCWASSVLGIWKGEGLGEGWERGGQFTINLRPRWTDPVTVRRVPSK